MMMGLEVLILVGVVAVVIWGARQGWNPARRRGLNQASTALEILERRYAEGAIDLEEFRERRSTLES